MTIKYLDRESKKIEEEKVYGGHFLTFLYANRVISKICLTFVARSPLVSWLYGLVQKTGLSRRKIIPFVQKYAIDTEPFEKPVEAFSSFNDFFIRTLKKEARPIASRACLPADARYTVFPELSHETSFLVKGCRFQLGSFVSSEKCAAQFEQGALVLARLCPVDYHRFHFPVACVPGTPNVIKGALFSVNPIATEKHPEIFWHNKRVVVPLETEEFGTVLCVCIGATNVGTIHYSFTPHTPYARGEEMGYFSFGGSALALLFQKDTIALAKDLLHPSYEVYGKMGQSLTEEIGVNFE